MTTIRLGSNISKTARDANRAYYALDIVCCEVSYISLRSDLSDSLASCFIFHVFVSSCRVFCVIGGQHSLMGVANQNTLD